MVGGGGAGSGGGSEGGHSFEEEGTRPLRES